MQVLDEADVETIRNLPIVFFGRPQRLQSDSFTPTNFTFSSKMVSAKSSFSLR